MQNEIQPITSPEIQPEAQPTTCLNCGTEFEGKFCPECGQKANTGRFTMRFIFQNLLTAILSNDGGVWFTVKNLFTRPGAMIVEILNGKRKRYFSPFPMLFLALTVYILIASFTGSRDNYNEFEKDLANDEETVQVDSGNDDSDKGTEYGNKISRFFSMSMRIYNNYYTAVYMLTLPVFALATRTFYGKNNRKRYNWAEYLIAIAYSMVMVILYRCLTSLAFALSESLSSQMGKLTPIVIIVAFTACFRRMMGFSIAKTAWRSVLAVALYYAILGFILIGGILLIAVIIVHKYG